MSTDRSYLPIGSFGLVVRFNVLGPVTASRGSETLDVGGPKQRTVLAMLIANAGEWVSADLIVEALYGDDARPNSRRTVQTYVSALRGVIGDAIEKAKGGWSLAVDDGLIDAVEAAELIESGTRLLETAPDRASALLREALALWRGHPYADIDARGLLDGEVVRLNELRSTALGVRIDADLALGRHAELIGEIEGIVVEHPFHERFRAQHMVALYRCGRQREALKSFEQLRSTLLNELGLDPSPDLVELEEQILNHDPKLLEVSSRRVEKRAVLVVDPGDPFELSRMGSGRLEETLAKVDRALRDVGVAEKGLVLVAGAATYAVLDSVAIAADLARRVATSVGADSPRIAVDWGDIERMGGGVSGPPLTRVAKLVSLAYPGQVLLSLEAQRDLVETGQAGLRFEALGVVDLPGLEGQTQVYQLLTDDRAQVRGLVSGRLPPPLPGGGVGAIVGYELRDQAGTGSIGDLYRGYQPSIGREVLVEVIPKTFSGDPEFVRRFELDLQRLSLFDHPNIAQILDYWREPDGAYVVYPAHRRGRLLVEDVSDPGRIIALVGSALGYAHSYGIVHGSLTPDRILLDESGEPHLFGFQIGGVSPTRLPEHAQYVAPEVVSGEKPTFSSDIYSMGMLARKLLSSVKPGADVVSRVLDPTPERRPATVSEFLIELNPEGVEAPESRFTQTRNPYKGLGTFEAHDAEDFYGRERVVTQIIEALSTEAFLALLGPSGSGKSSVVRAGAIPRIREDALGGLGDVQVAIMTPGRDPFLELKLALQRVVTAMPIELTSALAENSPEALAEVKKVLPTKGQLVLVIDQFEELFTTFDSASRTAFVDLLAITVRRGHARILVTLRADYLDRPLSDSRLTELFDGRTMTLGSMSRSELADAMAKPAEGVGLEVDPGLIERVLNDLHDEPGALPLLQQAMTELFEARSSDLLGVDGYESVGGVRGAVARRAESTFASLEPVEQDAAHRLFLRLVTVSENSPPTRRRVRVVDLAGIDGVQRVIEAFARSRLIVLDTDAETRVPTVEVAHEALLAHWPRLAGWIEDAREDLILARRLDEALAEWEESGRSDSYLLAGSRLAQHQAWAADSHVTLSPAERDYLRASQTRDEQVRRRRRRIRRGVMAGFGMAALVSVVFGLVALRNAEEAQLNAERALESEQQALDNEQLALENERRAEENASDAEAATRSATAVALTQAATAALASDPELSLLLALQAISVDPSSTAESVIHLALQEHRAIFRVQWDEERLDNGQAGGAMSPDGELLAMSDSAQYLEVWRVSDTSGPLWKWTPPVGLQLETPVFTADSTRLVVPVAVTTVGLTDPQRAVRFTPSEPMVDWPAGTGFHTFDATTGELLGVTALPSCYFSLVGRAARVTPDARLLVRRAVPEGDSCGFLQGGRFVELGHVDLEDGVFTPFGIVGRDSPGDWMNQSVDGRYVAFAELGMHRVVDTSTGASIYEKENFTGIAPVVSNGGTLILEGIAERPAELRSLETGELLRTFHPAVGSAVFGADDSVVIGYNSGDGVAYVWDTGTGRLSHILPAAATDQNLVYVSDDSAKVAGFGNSGIVHEIGSEMVSEDEGFVFEPVEGGFIPRTPRGLDVASDLVVFSVVPDGHPDFWDPPYFMTRVLRTTDGTVSAEWLGQTAVLSADGRITAYQPARVVEAARDPDSGEALGGPPVVLGPVELRDSTSGEVLSTVEGQCGYFVFQDVPAADCSGDANFEFVTSLQFAPDGQSLAGIGDTGDRLMLWTVPNGNLIWSRPSELAPGGPRLIQFSPDGRSIVLMDDKVGLVIDVVDGTTAAHFEVENEAFSMAFAPDGSSLYVGDLNANVLVFETETWTRAGALGGQSGGALSDIALSPSGRLLATAGNDGEMWLWDVQGETVLLQVPLSENRLQNVEFLNEDRLLVGSTHEVIVLLLDSDELAEVARSRLTRGFSAEECATYSIDPCPTFEEIRVGH